MSILFIIRYILDENSRLSTNVDVKKTKPDGVEISESSNGELWWLPDNVKDFILPAGFPGTKHQKVLGLIYKDI